MEKEPANKKWQTVLFGDSNSMDRFPLLNRAILGFVAVSTVVYCLFLIAPVVTFLAKTPLYHAQSFLGILGGLLLCADLVTNKGLWRGPWCVLLYGICAVAALASVRTISYGVKDNLYILAWSVIQIALFYSCAWRTSREKLQKFCSLLFAALFFIWAVACAISVCQYILQIGYLYVVDPLADDISTARQGFIENRLFGIFNPLNHAAYISAMLLTIAVYYFRRKEKWYVRLPLVLGSLILLSHIILSGSRSAQVSLFICAFFVGFCVARNRLPAPHLRRLLLSCGAAVLSLVLFWGGFSGSKVILAQLPSIGIITPDDESTPGSPTPSTPSGQFPERTDLDDNVSNNRFAIWKDYLGLYGDVGLIGLSPGNYMSYVRENHPELYIVRYIRENYPEKFAAGSIYHVHNGYLMAYVSAGFLGIAGAAAFLVLYLIRVLRYLFGRVRVSGEFIVLCCLVGMGCVCAMFDKALFFMDSAPTFLFWLAIGLLMKLTDKRACADHAAQSV